MSQAPLGCTCDPTLPARRRCTTRTLRCDGALQAWAARADGGVPDLAERISKVRGMSRGLGSLAATARPGVTTLTHEQLGMLAMSAEMLEGFAADLLRRTKPPT